MSASRINRLTKRQQDCLRLVARGYTSKEIGRQLGISYSTVDNHIQAAIQLLEVEGRAEAGRLFAQLESGGNEVMAPAPAAAEEPDPLPVEAEEVHAETALRAYGQSLPSQPQPLAETRAEVDAEAAPSGGKWRFARFLPPLGGRPNALDPSQTILAIARIAFLAALAFIACIMVVKMSFMALS